ncbi:MAG: carbohydrate-binding family 9-like protein [Candidatus Marinimicrobia bacterium]|nr:carbohydrate-binding family 9-like protein [Candidatus Neomarinimicrobiota bacterium]
MNKQYHIHKNSRIYHNVMEWDAPEWKEAEIAKIKHFHPKSSEHHPRTEVKIQYNQFGIFLLFRVQDRYVRSCHLKYNDKVHEDSCVEWFIQPPDANGYYNFEINCGGTLHVNYIIDPTRDENGKRRDIRPIPEHIAQTIAIKSSLPHIVNPEITRPIEWYLAVYIPMAFFTYLTPIENINSSIWRGNLYKCGDKTSHPHWGAWKSIDELNFHQPACFGQFIFDD